MKSRIDEYVERYKARLEALGFTKSKALTVKTIALAINVKIEWTLIVVAVIQ